MKANLATWFGSAAAALCLVSTVAPQANAGQLVDGWNYSIETSGNGSGGAVYDFTGLAIKDTGDSIIVALNTGMSLGGTNDAGTKIGLGDLFFNFTGKDFATANAEGSLLAVRFDPTTDSTNNNTNLSPTLTGVYSGVTAKSVALTHDGYNSINQYFDYGWGFGNVEGDLATQDAVRNYYGSGGSGPIYNVIDTGTKVADVTLLTKDILKAGGLDFSSLGAGSPQTIGFQFSKAALGNVFGSYVANIFMECGNGGIAVAGTLAAKAPTGNTVPTPSAGGAPTPAVPEPAEIGGVALAALILGTMKLKASKRSNTGLKL